MSMDTPQVQTEYAVYGLHRAIADVDELRLRNDTADFILDSERDIAMAAQMLNELLDDIRTANRNHQVTQDKIVVSLR